MKHSKPCTGKDGSSADMTILMKKSSEFVELGQSSGDAKLTVQDDFHLAQPSNFKGHK